MPSYLPHDPAELKAANVLTSVNFLTPDILELLVDRMTPPGPCPLVVFGPRRPPLWILEDVADLGARCADAGIPVWSGGARGVDSAAVAACAAAGGSVRVFYPRPGSGVPGLFARSALCLDTAKHAGGAAVVYCPAGATSGGSFHSIRLARRSGLPLAVVFFDPLAPHPLRSALDDFMHRGFTVAPLPPPPPSLDVARVPAHCIPSADLDHFQQQLYLDILSPANDAQDHPTDEDGPTQ